MAEYLQNVHCNLCGRPTRQAVRLFPLNPDQTLCRCPNCQLVFNDRFRIDMENIYEQGYFETAIIGRNRLYSQVIDNLNKAAVVGFPHTEVGARLQRAWIGEPSQARLYADAQHAASLYREYCLAHNLLDFSLQVEVFMHHLWPLPACREYLAKHNIPVKSEFKRTR